MPIVEEIKVPLLPPFSCAALAGTAVAVTGASGFLGAALVRGLLASGARVTAPVRSGRAAGALRAEGASAPVVDFGRSRDLAAAFDGAEVLFHFAYDMRAGAAENLALFDRVLEAAQAAGVPRIVHASSIAVYDGWPRIAAIDEASPAGGPPVSAYAQAKREMERRLLSGGPAAVAILQPTIVYGPGSTLWTLAPLAALRHGGVVLPEPAGICPAVYVDDVVQAALLAAALPELERERFLVNGADRFSWTELFEAYRELAGTGVVRREPLVGLEARIGAPPPPGPSRAPGLAAQASAALRRRLGHGTVEALAGAVRSLSRGKGPVDPTPGQLALYAASPAVDIARARSRLGYAPRFGLQDAIRAIAAGI